MAKLFNSYYINIVEKSNATKAKTFGINFENTNVQSVRDIVISYRNHASIIRIKQAVNGSNVSDSESFFSFKTLNETQIKNHLINLDINTTKERDWTPIKYLNVLHHNRTQKQLQH